MRGFEHITDGLCGRDLDTVDGLGSLTVDEMEEAFPPEPWVLLRPGRTLRRGRRQFSRSFLSSSSD